MGRKRQGLPDRRGACRRRPRSQHPNPHQQLGRLRVRLEDHCRIRLYEQHLAARHLRDHGRERPARPVQHRPVFSVEHDRYNVLAGGSASAYPTPNAFPTVAQWQASFEDFAGGDYRLRPTSSFFAAGVNGSVPGADLDAVYAAVNAGGTSVTPPGTTEPPPPTSSNSAPVARPGGPYTGSPGASVTVDGSASSDTDGSIASYRWTWGDEIVMDAADVPSAGIVGSKWVREQVSGAARGWVLHNPNANSAKLTAASPSPSSYVEVRFHAAAGVAYHLCSACGPKGIPTPTIRCSCSSADRSTRRAIRSSASDRRVPESWCSRKAMARACPVSGGTTRRTGRLRTRCTSRRRACRRCACSNGRTASCGTRPC